MAATNNPYPLYFISKEGGCGIGDEGAKYLSEADWKYLQNLDLSMLKSRKSGIIWEMRVQVTFLGADGFT